MDNYKRLFKLRFLVLILIFILIPIIVNCVFRDYKEFITIFNSVYFSLFASVLVGIYFQFMLKDEISTEHLKIMEFKDEYNKSGIIKYYASFKNCEQDLRNDMLKTTSITIYLAYGLTVLNTLSEQINFILSNPDKSVSIAFLSEKNPFINGLAQHWDIKPEELIDRIKQSKRVVTDLAKEKKNQNLFLYDNHSYPINYSFYMLDDLVYFVPTKLCNPKSFVPFTIKAQRTSENEALFGKIKEDWDKLFDKLEKIKIED